MKYQRPHKLKYGKWGLIFILPFFIAYGIFNLYPLIMTFYNSFFSKYEDLFDTVVQFVGFDNYVKVFTEGQILKYFGNTFLLWLLGFIPQILISLLFASWFTDLRLKLKGTGAVKVILYLPNMLMASSVAVLFATLFAVTGPVNQLFGTAFNFLEDEWSIRLLIAFINFIMWTGNTTILLMAGIMGIDPALYEASSIDGASAGQQFKKITLPMLKPIMLYVMVTSMIGGLQMFDIPFLFHTKRETINKYLETAAVFVYKNFRTSEDKVQYGYAGAASIILFIITAILGIIVFRMNRDADEARKKKERKELVKAYKREQKLAKMGGVD